MLTVVCFGFQGSLMGPKWNWMAYSNDRWATAVCCAKMFTDSTFDAERHSKIDGYSSVSPYARNKLIPSFPVWWNTEYNDLEPTRVENLMCRHFVHPTVQQLIEIYRNMKTTIYFPRFVASTDGKVEKVDIIGNRTRREFQGMPILNSVSIGQPVTKLSKTTVKTADPSKFNDFKLFTNDDSRVRAYSYEDRLLEPLLPLIVHFIYEVLHGPEYIQTCKAERFRDSLLCLGNLKASYTKIQRPVIDKIAMAYMFYGRSIPKNFVSTIFQEPEVAFDYSEEYVRDKMMRNPTDIGSICRFFTSVVVVCNVITAKEIKEEKERSLLKPFFAERVASLFERIEDKTSTQHRDNIAIYGETNLLLVMC